MLSYNYTVLILEKQCFIYAGALLRMRWMRYEGDWPARSFLEQYPEDFSRFLHRIQEMGNTGKISLPAHGHWLKPPYRDLFEFKMAKTRAFGFQIERTFVITSAATKKKKGAQVADYDAAMALRTDYLDNLDKHND